MFSCWAPAPALGHRCTHLAPCKTFFTGLQFSSQIVFPQSYISLRHVPGLPTLPHYLPNGSRFLSESNPTNGFNFSRGRSNPEHSLTCTPRPYLLAQYTEILFGQDHDS